MGIPGGKPFGIASSSHISGDQETDFGFLVLGRFSEGLGHLKDRAVKNQKRVFKNQKRGFSKQKRGFYRSCPAGCFALASINEVDSWTRRPLQYPKP